MFEEYMKNKINEVKNMSGRKLIECMYENGELPEIEYEKYISQLDENEENVESEMK